MKRKSLAAVAAAVGAVAGLIPSGVRADSTIDYDPVVSVVGDGSALGANGYTSSIDVFNNSVAGQATPLASQSYTGLINTDSTAEMTLANNPGVADAAAAGTSYSGTAYVYSGGYAGTDNTATATANRVVGDMTVTSAAITNPTLGASYSSTVAYEGTGSIRGAVGDNTATNIWTAGSNGTGFTGGFRYWNNNVQESGQATFNGGALATETNTRAIQIRNGQLYGSSDTGSFIGISAIGVGTPQNTAQNPDQSTSALLFQTGTNSANFSPYSFLLIDNPNNPNTPTVTNSNGTQVSVPYNVAYIADNGDPTGVNTDTIAGIEKWVYSPSTPTNNGWSLAYVIGDSADSGTTDNKGGYFGLAGQLLTNANTANDQVLLYGTTFATTTAGGSLEQFTDPIGATTAAAADATEITLATAPANYEFRGVALAPIVGPANLYWDNAGGAAPTDGLTWDIGVNDNWNNGSVVTTYSDGANVTFNDTNNSDYAVSLNTTVKPGSVTVNTTGSYTISGTGSIAGSGSLTKSGSGTLTLATANAYTGGTNVSGGLLVIDRTSSTTSALPTGLLTITGGEVALATNVTQGSQSANTPVTAPASNVNITSLAISGNGTLDIGNNHIIIDYTPGNDPISSIAAWIASGFNASGTHWAGTGITSSAAATNSGSYGIGYADANDAGNPAGLSSGQIEIMYTLLGDANLDGKVNGADFTLMAANFNDSVTDGWDKGDFNYSGTVNGDDFVLLANNFNDFASQSSVAGADLAALDAFAGANGISLTSVPEPTSAVLLTAGAAALLSRKRARRR